MQCTLVPFTDGAGREIVMQMYRRYNREHGVYSFRTEHYAQIQRGYIAYDAKGNAVGCVYLCFRSLPQYDLFDIFTIDGYNFIEERAVAYREARRALRCMLQNVPPFVYTFASYGREEIIALVRPFGFREYRVRKSGVLLRRIARQKEG